MDTTCFTRLVELHRFLRLLAFAAAVAVAIFSVEKTASAQCRFGDLNNDGVLDAADLAAFHGCLLAPSDRVFLSNDDPCILGDMPLRRPTFSSGVPVFTDGFVSMADVLAFQVASPTSPGGARPCVVRHDASGQIDDFTSAHLWWEFGDTTASFQRISELHFSMDNRRGTLCDDSAFTTSTPPVVIRTAIALWGAIACEFAANQPNLPDQRVASAVCGGQTIDAWNIQTGTLDQRNMLLVDGGPTPGPWLYYAEWTAQLCGDNQAQDLANYRIAFAPSAPTTGLNDRSSYKIFRQEQGQPAGMSVVKIYDDFGGEVASLRRQISRFVEYDNVLRWNHGKFCGEIKNFGNKLPGRIAMLPGCPLPYVFEPFVWDRFQIRHDGDPGAVDFGPNTYGSIHKAHNRYPNRFSISSGVLEMDIGFVKVIMAEY